MEIENDTSKELINSVVKSGVNLPSHVFHTNFMQYYFFDNDMGSSEYLINTTKTIISRALQFNGKANVFSSTGFRYWGVLSATDDWIVKIHDLRVNMEDNGDFGGMIIVDERKQWAIFQWYPIDIGVLAINSTSGLDTISDIIHEVFFDCTILGQWLEETRRHDGYLESFGLDSAFVMQLIENYNQDNKDAMSS